MKNQECEWCALDEVNFYKWIISATIRERKSYNSICGTKDKNISNALSRWWSRGEGNNIIIDNMSTYLMNCSILVLHTWRCMTGCCSRSGVFVIDVCRWMSVYTYMDGIACIISSQQELWFAMLVFIIHYTHLCLYLHLCVLVTWRDAVREPMNHNPTFLIETKQHFLHELLFSAIVYAESTKTLPTIQYTHNLLQLAKLVRLITLLELLGTQVKFFTCVARLVIGPKCVDPINL